MVDKVVLFYAKTYITISIEPWNYYFVIFYDMYYIYFTADGHVMLSLQVHFSTVPLDQIDMLTANNIIQII